MSIAYLELRSCWIIITTLLSSDPFSQFNSIKIPHIQIFFGKSGSLVQLRPSCRGMNNSELYQASEVRRVGFFVSLAQIAIPLVQFVLIMYVAKDQISIHVQSWRRLLASFFTASVVTFCHILKLSSLPFSLSLGPFRSPLSICLGPIIYFCTEHALKCFAFIS